MKEIFFCIKTKGVSTKKNCEAINKIPSNQNHVICFDYEGGGIWIKTDSDPMGVKNKLERQLDIELCDPKVIS